MTNDLHAESMAGLERIEKIMKELQCDATRLRQDRIELIDALELCAGNCDLVYQLTAARGFGDHKDETTVGQYVDALLARMKETA